MSSEHQDVHADLAATIASYAERSGGFARLRRLRDAPSGFDRVAWRQAAEFGWLGMLVPERLGGAGLGLAEAAVLAREAGRVLLPEPVTAGAVLAAGVLKRSESARGREALSQLIKGEAFAAVAWQEALGGLDPSEASVTAKDGTLSGHKSFVVFGGEAAGWLVSARNEAGIGIYWIEGGRVGTDYRPVRRADGSEHGSLGLSGVSVTTDDLVIPHGHGDAVLRDAVDESVVAIAAELLGVGERALEITLEHLKTRVQFGKAIGSFQALQHRCVDMFVRKELGAAALGAVLHAWADADATRRSALASRAKARCADATLDACRQAIQMHGAMGFTDECDIGLYLKRALVLSAWLGNAQIHRRRYALLALSSHGMPTESEAA